MKRRMAMAGALALSASACLNLRSVGTPIHRVYDRLPPGANGQSLIVLLPGRYDYAEDFERFGFMQAVRQARLPIDLVAVDANLRYLQRGLLVERLQTDVIAPARQRGYARIWLAGISLGGLAAMLYASKHSDIDGIIAIAPFLGRPAALKEIDNAGGLPEWQADTTSAMFDWEREPFIWLKRYLAALSEPQADAKPRLIMGIGRQDRFFVEQSKVAAALPPEDVFTAPGNHDWPVWLALWRDILNTYGELLAGFS